MRQLFDSMKRHASEMAWVNDEHNRLAIDALNLALGERVLELGFGPGWSLRTIAARTRGARVYEVDQSVRMLGSAPGSDHASVHAPWLLKSATMIVVHRRIACALRVLEWASGKKRVVVAVGLPCKEYLYLAG